MVENNIELATFGGGCFWCTEAVFERVKGVEKVFSGYAGGDFPSPTYEDVSSGATGHAEAVQLEFNPKKISFEHLLDIFFATHDPTQLNRQGNDVGTQYRSVIFYHSQDQHRKAQEKIKELQNIGEYNHRIVTEIVPFKEFYTAEAYHQKYYENYRDENPYCRIVIDPKVEKLLRKFGKDVKEKYL